MAGNSSQNENKFLQKNLIGLCVYFIKPNTLLLCILLFCIFLLYRADPQVEVQIRILLKDTLAACGLEGFFPVVLLCQFFGFWQEIGFGVTYLRILTTIQLWHCVCFLVLVGNSFWYYIRT